MPKGNIVFLNAWLVTWVSYHSAFDYYIPRRLALTGTYLDSIFRGPWGLVRPRGIQIERWFENPDTPWFLNGLEYRMCASSLLANRELYLAFLRKLNSFKTETHDYVNYHPIQGSSDLMSLVVIPKIGPGEIRAQKRSPLGGSGFESWQSRKCKFEVNGTSSSSLDQTSSILPKER